MRQLLLSCLQLPCGIWLVSFCSVLLAVELKNNSMHECFRISLRVTESASPMSRRRAANRRELLLPLRMPERYQTGIAFDPCVPSGPTGTIPGKAVEPAEAWTRRTTHCRLARQISQTIEGEIVALIAGNDLLARLIFQRICPRTHSGMIDGQSSPHELRRTRAPITSPDITTPLVNCADPALPPPEIETLFTQLARRHLRKRATEETR
jgi:hypothetical protein